MSGAGPCLIAFTVEKAVPVGEAMVAAFAKREISAKYLLLDIAERGVHIIH